MPATSSRLIGAPVWLSTTSCERANEGMKPSPLTTSATNLPGSVPAPVPPALVATSLPRAPATDELEPTALKPSTDVAAIFDAATADPVDAITTAMIETINDGEGRLILMRCPPV